MPSLAYLPLLVTSWISLNALTPVSDIVGYVIDHLNTLPCISAVDGYVIDHLNTLPRVSAVVAYVTDQSY